MKKVALLLLLGSAVLSATVGRQVIGQGHREGEDMPTVYAPKAIPWKDGPPSLPTGAKFAVLEGDPSKEGPFTMRLKVPNGYRIPPHTHPKTERLTVISGTFRLGMGETFDADKMRDLTAGTYGFWPAGMKHYAAAKGETIVQLHGIGPWQINYLNPSDDPRNKPK
jgi:quercetin dioxygenase-like cupin family protein